MKVVDQLRFQTPLMRDAVRRINPDWVRPSKAQGGHEYADDLLGALLSIAETFETAATGAQRDPDLSPTGRTKSAIKAAHTALARLGEIEGGNIARITARVTALEREVLQKVAPTRPTDPAERIAYELRLQEIRSDLRRLDPLQRLTVYLETSDPVVLDAIESAPPSVVLPATPGALPTLVPFIDPDRRREAVTARAERLAPAQAVELDALVQLREVYQSTVDTIRAGIFEEVPAVRANEPIVVGAAE